MKIRVASSGGNDNRDAYAAWGSQSALAKQQGFYPETTYNGNTVYRSPYYAAFNNVVIPNQKDLGHIAFIGNGNQKFDIVISDSKGNIQHTISQGITPDEVQQYITNQNSTVAQRNNSILNRVKPTDVAAK